MYSVIREAAVRFLILFNDWGTNLLTYYRKFGESILEGDFYINSYFAI